MLTKGQAMTRELSGYWYLAQARPHHMFRLADAFGRRGIQVYLPLDRRMRHRNGATRAKGEARTWDDIPAWGRYLCIRGDLATILDVLRAAKARGWASGLASVGSARDGLRPLILPHATVLAQRKRRKARYGVNSPGLCYQPAQPKVPGCAAVPGEVVGIEDARTDADTPDLGPEHAMTGEGFQPGDFVTFREPGLFTKADGYEVQGFRKIGGVWHAELVLGAFASGMDVPVAALDRVA